MAPNHPVVRAKQVHGTVKEFLPVLTALVTIAGAGLAAWEASRLKQEDATQDELLVDEHNKPLRVRYVLHHESFLSYLGGTVGTLLKYFVGVLSIVGLTWLWVTLAFWSGHPLVASALYGFVAAVLAALLHQKRYAHAWAKRMARHG